MVIGNVSEKSLFCGKESSNELSVLWDQMKTKGMVGAKGVNDWVWGKERKD